MRRPLRRVWLLPAHHSPPIPAAQAADDGRRARHSLPGGGAVRLRDEDPELDCAEGHRGGHPHSKHRGPPGGRDARGRRGGRVDAEEACVLQPREQVERGRWRGGLRCCGLLGGGFV